MLVDSRTTTELLEKLLEPDGEVWRAFDQRYRPVLGGVARRLGLPPADAEDAAQEALMRIAAGYREGEYQRDRGRLRSWMIAIARNCAVDALRARAARREQRGQSAFDQLPQPGELEEIWDDEIRRTIARRAIEELRAHTRTDQRTIKAFELVAVDGRSAADAAAALGLSVESVYAAKSRCARQLREIVAQLEVAYEVE